MNNVVRFLKQPVDGVIIMREFGSLARVLVDNRRAAAALEYSIIAAILAVDLTLILT